jgi:hypothetical protein
VIDHPAGLELRRLPSSMHRRCRAELGVVVVFVVVVVAAGAAAAVVVVVVVLTSKGRPASPAPRRLFT